MGECEHWDKDFHFCARTWRLMAKEYAFRASKTNTHILILLL